MPDGSLLIVDYLNHRIRRVAIDGTITTVAGNGSTVLAGDGGPADDASLRVPVGRRGGSGRNVLHRRPRPRPGPEGGSPAA